MYRRFIVALAVNCLFISMSFQQLLFSWMCTCSVQKNPGYQAADQCWNTRCQAQCTTFHHINPSMQVRSVTAVQLKAVINSVRVSGGKLQFKWSDWHFKRQKEGAIFIKAICSAQLLFMWKGMFLHYQFALSLPQIVYYFQAWSDQTYGQKATYSLILITHFGPCFKLTFSTRKVTWSPNTIRGTDIWDAFVVIRALLQCCKIARQLERNASLSFLNKPYKWYRL